MMKPLRHFYRRAACVSAVLLSACASAPSEQFYTLNAPLLAGGSGGTPLMVVAQVTVPELLDRPQLVLGSGRQQVTILEQQRWAEPLKSAISRALAGQLQAQLPGWQLALREHQAHREAKWEVWVDVLRFDSQLKQSAVLEANWSIRRRGEGNLRSGKSSLSQASEGEDIAAIIAAHEKLLAKLAIEIAQAAKELELQSERNSGKK